VVFWGVGFLGGCIQKNPWGIFGYVPGCLNPAWCCTTFNWCIRFRFCTGPTGWTPFPLPSKQWQVNRSQFLNFFLEISGHLQQLS